MMEPVAAPVTGREPPGRASKCAEALFVRMEASSWTGPDPYDALLSPVARFANRKRTRQILLQAVKRSPVNIRALLRVPAVRTATATGFAASACGRLAAEPVWGERRDRLAAMTLSGQLSGRYIGLWGYEFDVQTRWGYYPEGEPNIVATTFAADGCLAGDALDGEGAERVGRALLEHLATGEHFRYTPTSTVLIHNSNLMGASLAYRLSDREGVSAGLRSELRRLARSAVETTLDRQRPDGSWPYGEQANLAWIDGFHTAYVLLRLEETLGLGPDAWRGALERGARFYFDNLFDGASPKYSVSEPRRRDGNNAATALRMAVWGAQHGYTDRDFPARVFTVVEREGWISAFLDGRRRGRGSRLPAPRWLGVPLLDALTAWLAAAS